VAEFSFARRLRFYFRVIGKQFMYDETFIRALRRQLNVMFEEPRALRQYARFLADALELRLMKIVDIDEETRAFLAELRFGQTPRNEIECSQCVALLADKRLVRGGDAHDRSVAIDYLDVAIGSAEPIEEFLGEKAQVHSPTLLAIARLRNID
jgi:hypothetical protein